MNLKIEDQCVSLELAKMLKELNVKQESLFCWINDYDIEFLETIERNQGVCIAAFTVAELCDLLPAYIQVKEREPFNNFYLKIIKRSSKNIQYIINYECDSMMDSFPMFPLLMQNNTYDEKLSNALAKTLINLIEKGLYKV